MPAGPFGPDQSPDLLNQEGWIPEATTDPQPDDVIGLLTLLIQKVDTLQASVNRIKGLVGENQVSRDFQYDPAGSIISFAIRTYATPSDAETDDGQTGLLSEYSVTNTLSGDGLVEATTTTLSA